MGVYHLLAVINPADVGSDIDVKTDKPSVESRLTSFPDGLEPGSRLFKVTGSGLS